MSVKRGALPALIAGDVEDATLARLAKAEALIAQAEAGLARDIRDHAEAAMLLAQKQGATRLVMMAGRMRLLAEARLGELCPEIGNKGTQFGAKPAEIERVRSWKIEVEKVESDDDKRHQYRRVYEGRAFLDQYLDKCRLDEETPTRRGFLDYAEQALSAIRASERARDPSFKPKKPRDPAPEPPHVAREQRLLANLHERLSDLCGFFPEVIGAVSQAGENGPCWRAKKALDEQWRAANTVRVAIKKLRDQFGGEARGEAQWPELDQLEDTA